MNVYIVIKYESYSVLIEPEIKEIIEVFKDKTEAEAISLALNKEFGINWNDDMGVDGGYNRDIEEILYYEVIEEKLK